MPQRRFTTDLLSIGFCRFPTPPKFNVEESLFDEDALWAAPSAAPASAAPAAPGTAPPTSLAIPPAVLAALRVRDGQAPSPQIVHCVGCGTKATGGVSLNGGAAAVSLEGLSDADDSGSWFQQRFKDVLATLGLASSGDASGAGTPPPVPLSPLGMNTAVGGAKDAAVPDGAPTPEEPTAPSCVQEVWFGLCDRCVEA